MKNVIIFILIITSFGSMYPAKPKCPEVVLEELYYVGGKVIYKSASAKNVVYTHVNQPIGIGSGVVLRPDKIVLSIKKK